MSRPSNVIGKAPGQRANLPRRVRRSEFKFRPERYEQLVSLVRWRDDGRPESLVDVVERLILQASEQPQLFGNKVSV